MDKNLVETCQMFLIPASILFTALGVATTEALKTLLSAMGTVLSLLWLYRLAQWTEFSDADATTAFGLAWVFTLGAVISLVVHFLHWRDERKRGSTGAS